MTEALARRPADTIQACELTWIERRPIDVERMRRQHADYVAALEASGVNVTVLDAVPEHPDATFVEDAAVVFPQLVVLGRSGAPSRRAEAELLLDALPVDRPRLRLQWDATLDGGDVLVVGRTVFVGRSTRTNGAAVIAMRDALGLAGYRVVEVPVQGALHLKTAVTAARPDLLVARARGVDLRPMLEALPTAVHVITVPDTEPAGANVLPLPGGRVLVPASAPDTAERLRRSDVEVATVDLSEFEKAEAGTTCLSILW